MQFTSLMSGEVRPPTPCRRVFRCLAVLLLPLLLWCIGCDDQADPAAKPALPYQGQTIQLVVPQGWGFKDRWELQLQEWSAQAGAQAELTEIDMQDGSGPLLQGGLKPQVIILPWTRRGELLAEKQLQALPTDALVESQLDWSDLFQGLRERQGQAERGPTFVPLGTPVLSCYYRLDLLEKAGLKPPETWADYHSLVEQLETWAPGLKVVEPWSPEFRATMFLARAIPYVKHSGHYSVFFDIENGAPFISSPGYVKALEEAQATISKLPPEVLQYDPVTCRNLVLSGAAALAIGLDTGPAGLPLNIGSGLPQTGEKPARVTRPSGAIIGISRLPGSPKVYNPTLQMWVVEENAPVNYVAYTGFAGLCAAVPQGTSPEKVLAALNLLSSLLLDSGSTFPANCRWLCRESQTPDAELWVGRDMSASEAGKYVAVTAKSLRDRQQVSELPVLGHAEFRAALTAGLTQAIEKKSPATEVLANVNEEWKKIAAKLGADKVLSSYRSALGLTKLEEL